jgi:hypothetical protein
MMGNNGGLGDKHVLLSMNRLPQDQRWKDPFPGDWALIDKYACARNVAEFHKGPVSAHPSYRGSESTLSAMC